MLEVDIQIEFNSRGASSFKLEADIACSQGINVIIGPTGSGKSTLLYCIAGLIKPSRGRIVNDGTPLFNSSSGLDVSLNKRGVGIVFQDNLLFPHMTVAENVLYGVRNKNHREAESLTDEILSYFEIDKLRDSRPNELSGGEKQRVALASAVIGESDILLLDEPLSAIDPDNKKKMIKKIVELQKRVSAKALYVTHDYSEAVDIGDVVYKIQDGCVKRC